MRGRSFEWSAYKRSLLDSRMGSLGPLYHKYCGFKRVSRQNPAEKPGTRESFSPHLRFAGKGSLKEPQPHDTIKKLHKNQVILLKHIRAAGAAEN